MDEETIRPIAICVCRDGERILVAEYLEKGRLYYRPLGGGIQFGEHGHEAVQRELREEIGAEISEVRYLGLLENIYSIEGARAHQIVLVYDGRLTDRSFYKKEYLVGDELGEPFKVVWKRLDEFVAGKAPVYPDCLNCWGIKPTSRLLGGRLVSVGGKTIIQIAEHITDGGAKDE
jgi:8-oxo-dGTP pyrophosphatase MutT (NUDIX family)